MIPAHPQKDRDRIAANLHELFTRLAPQGLLTEGEILALGFAIAYIRFKESDEEPSLPSGKKPGGSGDTGHPTPH